jgi:hypothetical protein
MSSTLFIGIIKGVFGGAISTYISGYIYEYFNKNRQPIPQIIELTQPPLYEPKYKYAKNFEEILNIQIGEHISNKINTENVKYEYDNEHGNTFEFKNDRFEEENTPFINALYDNNYDNFYKFHIIISRNN